MHGLFRTALSLSLLLGVVGCSTQPPPEAAAPELPLLTAEVAKQAILHIDWQDVGFTLIRRPQPGDAIEVLSADEIKVGNWTCNLKEKTFHGHTIRPEATRHQLSEIEGVFERDAQGCWVAKVTMSIS